VAWALNPRYRIVNLAFEFDELRRTHESSGLEGLPELPSFIVGIGRKRIEMAKVIRQWSGGWTKLVHVGRLRGSLDDIDYLVTTPAYPVSPSSKVISLDIALSDKIRRLTTGGGSSALSVNEVPLSSAFSAHRIRPNWINVFIGNPLHRELDGAPRRLRYLAHQLNRLAKHHDRDLAISGAPRTLPGLYDVLGSALTCRHHLYRWTANDSLNPFEMMVRMGRDSIVTADSITMISQLLAAGHRTLIFPWHTKRRRTGLLARLPKLTQERQGKDTAAFRAALCRQRLSAELNDAADFDLVRPRPGIQDELIGTLRAFLR
jgi:mitochondrial fission protein ELM1